MGVSRGEWREEARARGHQERCGNLCVYYAGGLRIDRANGSRDIQLHSMRSMTGSPVEDRKLAHPHEHGSRRAIMETPMNAFYKADRRTV